jgi:hypothetical protein
MSGMLYQGAATSVCGRRARSDRSQKGRVYTLSMDAARRSSKEHSDETSATQSSSIAARQGLTRPCNPFTVLAAMHSGVACRAQRDQVGLGVGSRMAAELPVMHLKIRHRATELTPPAVATQDLLAQIFVRRGIQPQASGFWRNILMTPSHTGYRGRPAAVRRARTCSSVRSS